MFRNYLTITLRNIRKFSAYSFINIAGLAIGMVCFALISLYVIDELSYNKYHEKVDNLYRVNVMFKSQANELDLATSPPPMGPALKNDFPEILEFARIRGTDDILVAYREKKFYESDVAYADSTFFSLFNYNFKIGDPLIALSRPNTAVVTESIAEKYFGDADPIGKILRINATDDFEITGIIEDIPSNSDMRFNIIGSNIGRLNSPFSVGDWTDIGDMYTFVYVLDGCDTDELGGKILGIADKYAGVLKDYGITLTTTLQPLKDIHLNSGLGNEFDSASDKRYVYIFSTIGVFILLIACINYMNLATARSSIRVREVGMRKVLGAERFQLIKQFLGESILFSVLAAVFAVAMIELFLPYFNSITGKAISINYSANQFLTFAVFGSAIMVGVISGSYPAFVLSSFKPISMLQGKQNTNQRDSVLRKGLVVLQFAISIILIIGTILVSQQLNYFQEKDLGLNPEQILVISLQETPNADNYLSFKNELLQSPGIISVAASNGTPGKNSATARIVYEKGKSIEDQKIAMINSVDYDFIDLYNMNVLDGRNFSQDIAEDAGRTTIVNEALIKEMGWKTAVGKNLIGRGDNAGEFKVIGVVKDFHYFSLDQEITPMILFVQPLLYNFVSVKIRTENISETMEYINNKWNEFSPNYPITYSFVDEDFASQYREQERFGLLFKYFSVLAIIIACLGLFGLSSFTAEQRTKEIGIRKALGSTIPGIVVLLTREFSKWVLAANIIAWPVAYIWMNYYLDNFAFRIGIGIGSFIISSVIAFIIALITVSFQAMKAAASNPVDSLRAE
ncbi:MAG: FtsX-like permease family protein [bacterium]|nr:FtsX-like permease family protein [bacterium]